MALDSMPSIPRACAAVCAVMAALSGLCALAPSTAASLLLVPGHTVLGEHYVWNIITAYFIDTHLVKLCMSILLVALLASRAEPSSVPGMAGRVARCVCVSVAVTGAFHSFLFLGLFLLEGREPLLYAPMWGTGPVLVSIAVAAHQVAGETAVFSDALPFVTYALMPAAVVVSAAVSTLALETSRDVSATVTAWVLSWVYLRFVHVYENGSVGDMRDEFEFLSMFPAVLRLPLRPLIKLLSAIFLRLPLFKRATGDGMRGLPPVSSTYGTVGAKSSGADLHGGAAGRAAADPVAERRRERALAALDKKLAEMRVSLRGSASAPVVQSVPAAASVEPPQSVVASLLPLPSDVAAKKDQQ